MSRKSKRVSEAVRPVIENLQPRMLLSGTEVPPPVPPMPVPPWLENVDQSRQIAMPAGASASTGGIVISGLSATVYGTDGDDTIVITPGGAMGEVRVSGVAGVPDGTLIDGLRSLEIMGGNGNDHISVDSGQMVWSEILAGDGDDVLVATGRVDNMVGGRGNDVIHGSAQNERMDGGPGNDSIDGGGGIDSLFVGSTTPPQLAALFGEDCVTSGVIVRMDLGTIPNDGFGGQDVIANISDVYVASYLDDVVYGDGKDNHIVCSDGSDTIYGGGGDDQIAINFGSGLLSGGAGDDRLFTASADVIMDGGTGRNTYEYNIPGERVETITSGEPTQRAGSGVRPPELRMYAGHTGFFLTLYGTDQDDVITIEAGDAPGRIIVKGVAGFESFVNIAAVSIYAGAGNDTVTINMASVDTERPLWATIYGEEGNDLLIAQCRAELVGGAGDDTLIGSAEDDKLSPGRGNDSVDGGGGMDMLYIENTSDYYVVAAAVGEENAPVTSRVIVRLDQGTVPMDGFGGQDMISGIEGVSVSSPYDDEIYGDAGDNLIIVSGGNDTVYAGAGDDVLIGLMGAHRLFGDEGNDVFSASDSFNPHIIDGGPGYDVIRDSWDIPGIFSHNPGQQTDVPVAGDEQPVAGDEQPGSVPAAPDAAWAAPKKRLGQTQAARRAHLVAKRKAAKLKAAKLKARLAKVGDRVER